MNLKELLNDEEILKKYDIVIRDDAPTLRFAEDIKVVGIDTDKNQIAIIPYDEEKIPMGDIAEILSSYSIIDYLSEYDLENSEWKDKLDCVWLDNEESRFLLEEYGGYRAILILQKRYSW